MFMLVLSIIVALVAARAVLVSVRETLFQEAGQQGLADVASADDGEIVRAFICGRHGGVHPSYCSLSGRPAHAPRTWLMCWFISLVTPPWSPASSRSRISTCSSAEAISSS